uniref:Uncharacterized protein n=1 Tax=Helianthus annuus TaxID=4232 RepID=A0A251VGV0_HELAN
MRTLCAFSTSFILQKLPIKALKEKTSGFTPLTCIDFSNALAFEISPMIHNARIKMLYVIAFG